jgi:predicted transcriptional regulator
LAILAAWGFCTFAVGFGCGTYVGRWIGAELEAQQSEDAEFVLTDKGRRIAEHLRRIREQRASS